jgi:hypothetical protein
MNTTLCKKATANSNKTNLDCANKVNIPTKSALKADPMSLEVANTDLILSKYIANNVPWNIVITNKSMGVTN